jgi:hypothetical protein
MLNQNGLGDHRTDAARSQEPGNRNHDVDEKDDEIAHSVSLQERLTQVIVPFDRLIVGPAVEVAAVIRDSLFFSSRIFLRR